RAFLSSMSLFTCALLRPLVYSSFVEAHVIYEIYSISLHDALPISRIARPVETRCAPALRSSASTIGLRTRSSRPRNAEPVRTSSDRKSTRLNSSHQIISYAVFCLKKKHKTKTIFDQTTQ